VRVYDSHCHLDFPDFAQERDAIVARAQAAGVERMITISTRVRQGQALVAIAEAYEPVYFTIGTHPHQAAEEAETDVDAIRAFAAHPKCVGLGEAGLDYHYNYAPEAIAKKVFRAQIALSRELRLPLVIHAREADDDVAAILREEMAAGPFKALLHCFTSSRALAEAGLELGLYVSFSGVLTFKNSADLRAIAKDVPLDRVLVETDAPFLAPVPHRGRRNEPAFVVDTARVLAEVKGVTPEVLGEATRANTLTLFSKMSAGVAA
jgi:TatD DNase family protein